ncbi:MAG: CheR family methyltransferase, partial [Janthinobacterium lividum]
MGVLAMADDMNDPEVAAEQGRRVGSLSNRCVVLVVGAPAASTDSLLRVLVGLPTEASLTVIVAMQHPEAFDENGFRRGLGAQADTLATVSDGAPVEPGRIYLPGRGTLVTVEGGRFRTRPAEGASEGHGAIDSLFVSLAADQDGHTIGLVLAGTGGDGVLGLAAVKEGGGLTLAETEDGGDGGEGGSKEAAAAAQVGAPAMADFVLPAEALAECIALHARQLARMQLPPAGDAPPAGTALAAALDRIAAVLLERTGHDFHGYKRPTFMRRVHRRMGVVGAERIEDYLDMLRGRPEEAQNLFNDLLIGVTRFFRDPREFEFLEREVVPMLFGSKGREDQVRVWVLGCASGEEAYSIAILLREHAARLASPPGVQIFATDLDTRALAVARAGRYPATIAQDVSPARLARWFTEEGATYAVSRELRDACVFSQHSLVKDTPFSRLDLVSCRNLLIYLGPELQDRVIPLLHFGLESGGYLFLGASEGIARHGKLFAPVERGMHIFRKLDTGRRVLPDFPARAVVRVPVGSPVRPRPGPAELGLLRRAERLAERHAPAYAVVDEAYDVLQFSPRAGRYIHPAGGAASLGLLDLAHADLRLHLRAALGEAAQEGRTARADGIVVDTDGQRSAVDLVVEAIPGEGGAPCGFVVLFKDAALPSGVDGHADGDGAPAASGEHVRWLEAELRTTRERLRAMVEQLEGANEELKSSNEEYQSLNEELQSANEELATSKEELQSLNEELTT